MREATACFLMFCCACHSSYYDGLLKPFVQARPGVWIRIFSRRYWEWCCHHCAGWHAFFVELCIHTNLTPTVVTFLQGLDSDNANIDLDAVLEQIAGTIHNFYDKEFERYASGISVQDCLRGCVRCYIWGNDQFCFINWIAVWNWKANHPHRPQVWHPLKVCCLSQAVMLSVGMKERMLLPSTTFRRQRYQSVLFGQTASNNAPGCKFLLGICKFNKCIIRSERDKRFFARPSCRIWRNRLNKRNIIW